MCTMYTQISYDEYIITPFFYESNFFEVVLKTNSTKTNRDWMNFAFNTDVSKKC